MRKVVHFEIPADDVERAKGFYGSIFGWQLQTMPIGESEYTIVVTTPIDDRTQQPTEAGGINGGMMKRTGSTPRSPVLTIDVNEIDVSLKEIEAQDGKVVTPRTEIPGMGAFAYFEDPEGNVLGLWETSPGAG